MIAQLELDLGYASLLARLAEARYRRWPSRSNFQETMRLASRVQRIKSRIHFEDQALARRRMRRRQRRATKGEP